MSFRANCFDAKILNIAYSKLNSICCPANTEEHFLTACKLGFNALKADVRPTADGGLILCHDPGFTLNSEGRITEFDNTNYIPIIQMSTETALALEHEAFHEELGYHARPCTFEQYARICKEYGMICYPTIRNEKMEIVIPSILSVLSKYGMKEHTMINSMTLSSLQRVREFDREIALCYTLDGKKQICCEHVDSVIALGNAVLDGFNFPYDDAQEKIQAAQDAIAYAHEKGIRLYQAQVKTYAQYSMAFQCGFTGFHILNPILAYVPVLYTFQLEVSDGKVTFRNTFPEGGKYSASVSVENNELIVRDIRLTGSGRSFADGIMPVWLHALPAALRAWNNEGDDLHVEYSPEDHGIQITGIDLTQNSVLRVHITV